MKDKRLIAIQENLPCCKMYVAQDGTLTLKLNDQEITGLTPKDLKGARTLIDDVLWMKGRYAEINEDDL